MQHSNFPFEVKSVSESGDGTFAGFASVYNNVDLQGDSVQPGAFTKTLRDAKGSWIVLAGHDKKEEIGFASLEDSPHGLKVDGHLVLHTDKAKQTYALMRAKAIRGMSIGYDTVRSVMRDGVRQLTELKLYEVSLTPWPANELALVTSIKDASDPVAQFRRMMLLCTREIRGQ
jgi:uncharacterized protein